LPAYAFEFIRAAQVGADGFDLDDGEVVAITDPAVVEQWWTTLHDLRLAAGTPRQPTFRHLPTAVGRI